MLFIVIHYYRLRDAVDDADFRDASRLRSFGASPTGRPHHRRPPSITFHPFRLRRRQHLNHL